MEKDKLQLTEVCRVCANKIKDKKRQRHIFNYLRGKLLQNLKLITGVELLPNENLSMFICERCFSELDLAVKFRERCIFSQNYLEEMLKQERKESLETYENELSEDLIDEDQLEYVDDDENDDEEFNYEDDADNSIGLEQEEECIEESDDVIEDVETLEEEEQEGNENLEVAGYYGKRPMEELDDNRPKKRLRNFFICEECGEYFKIEAEYKAHLDGHFQHKPSKQFFPCQQCSASFNSKNLLQNHHREEHGGKRLFKCATCGEEFLEHSAKQRHEIAHVNERPYPCLECKKIFSSVSELRMHYASHRNPKFRCEPCNKDFMTRNQLLEHSMTHPHKRTMQHMQDEFDMLCGGDAEELESENS